MTSLMNSRGPNDETSWNQYGGVPAAECELGAISYENDFEPVSTTCFGPGGYYESKHTSIQHHSLCFQGCL